jgi:UDP-N-acetylglucosamine 4,6-dehydratase
MELNLLRGKTLLVTGGTGSFGGAIIVRLLKSGLDEIRIFSRDEKKQDDMRKLYADDRLKFYIGDVRDYAAILDAVRGVDFVFHAAALKQVPSCEFYPSEAFKTNVMGTENVLEAATVAGVKRVVCLSTDKAVYPINAMGLSKAMMEKVAIAKARSSKTIINITRYGNVAASRGSVIPLFCSQILDDLPLTLTDGKMTRFMMTLEDAVDLVLFAFETGKTGELFVQKAPAVSLGLLTDVIKNLFGKPDHPVELIGTRHGEKLYETLLSREEMAIASDIGAYYKVAPDLRSLNYVKFVERGESAISDSSDFNSHNAPQLDATELQRLLRQIPEVVEYLGIYSANKGV